MIDYSPLWKTMQARGVSQYQLLKNGIDNRTLDALKKAVEEYADKIETVMFPFNIVESQGTEILKLAREKGMGTICMKPMAGGNLEDWTLALKFIDASGVMDISIPGMGSAEEVDRNAAAAESFGPLTAEELEKCESIRRTLGTTFCRRCGYCAPCRGHQHSLGLPLRQLSPAL